jgi:hypothetical protein
MRGLDAVHQLPDPHPKQRSGYVERDDARRLGDEPMNRVNQVVLFLHFVGMALGFSVSFGNMVMSSLIAKAAPADKATLGRFPPAMSKLGRIGLALLWVTGGFLVYTRWGWCCKSPVAVSRQARGSRSPDVHHGVHPPARGPDSTRPSVGDGADCNAGQTRDRTGPDSGRVRSTDLRLAGLLDRTVPCARPRIAPEAIGRGWLV